MKRALIAVGLITTLALLAPPAQAQSGGARGKVVDSEGQPIADATVTLEFMGGVTRKYEVRTNKKGEYIQVGLSTGPYRITVSKEGYEGRAFQARVMLGLATDLPPVELLTQKAAAQQPGSDQQVLREKFARGVELTKAGQVDEAVAVFEEILELQAGIPEVHTNLGYLYSQQKDWAKAEAAFLAALDLRPGEPDYVAALAKIYQESGQEEKAKELVAQAASDNPEDGTAQFNQGIFLLKEGKNEEAMVSFESSLAADQPMAEAHYYLGTLLVGQGKVPEAIEHLEAYLASNPESEQNAATAQGLLEALKQ